MTNKSRSILRTGLLSACLAGTALTALPAHAGIVWLSGTSLESIMDKKVPLENDDHFLFINKTSSATQSFSGTVLKNSSGLDNINFVTNADVTTGSGQANVKAVGTTLTTITVTPGSDLPNMFDGMMMRGSVDTSGKCTKKAPCDVTFKVTFSDNSTASNTFDTIKNNGDFGAIGFDENPGTTGLTVSKVVVSVAGGDTFDEIKQMGFSIPGASVVPEAPSWAMLFLGFAGLSYVGIRRSRKDRDSALA
jgi:hypothetical protein